MKWTLFVLDFDGTYNDQSPDLIGISPMVYLIPLNKQKDVERMAKQASKDFHSDENSESGLCIVDIFEQHLENDGIKFKEVGYINLSFEERQVDYLADYIPREVV